uniref:Uncharacterized protein n=1 Tax=Picea sitchensis TaxID=3332 RepID=D5ABH5_PICSI|nr:unknown [Picea sitchensis]
MAMASNLNLAATSLHMLQQFTVDFGFNVEDLIQLAFIVMLVSLGSRALLEPYPKNSMVNDGEELAVNRPRKGDFGKVSCT